MPTRRKAEQQHFVWFDTAIGKCALAFSDSGITCVQLPEKNAAQTLARLQQRFRAVPWKKSAPPPMVAKAIARLTSHLAGKAADLSSIKLDLENVPPFHRKVYEAARLVPPGRTVSYAELADRAGSPRASRAVGQAMAKNPCPLVVPCHRVLGADGAAVGFSAFGGCDLKQRLLEMEGAPVSEQFERRFDMQKKTPPKTFRQRPAKAERQRFTFEPAEAIDHISARDKRMARLISQVGEFRLELDEMQSPFEALAESIVYQQLTGKAAATIFARVKALYGGALPAPRQVADTSDATLRGAGLSAAKALALKDLARKADEGLIPSLAQLERMSDEEIVIALTSVRGIGRWTAQMLLIFRLGRPDVLPVDDYGVRKGFARTFRRARVNELPTPKELAAHGERWRPYRSVASWYLWRATDAK